MCSKEKEVLLYLLDKYKNMPHLWKKEHRHYLNKEMRAEGFKALLDIYQTFDEKATLQAVKKKIENMRTNFCKEMKKVLASKYAGVGDEDIYVPTLWYFDALSFLEERLTEPCHSVTASIKNEKLSSGGENVNTLKRKKMETPIEVKERIEAAKNTTNSSQKDEQWDVYGKSLGYQVKDLNQQQLAICQKLIADAIFFAKLNKLNENSHIVNPSNEDPFG